MKALLTILMAAALSCSCLAGPHHHRPAPAPVHHIHHRPGPWRHTPPPPPPIWGRGGRYFWPSFGLGVATGLLLPTPAPRYEYRQVWIPGHHIDQLQPNGTILRVWVPGHYEARQVLVP